MGGLGGRVGSGINGANLSGLSWPRVWTVMMGRDVHLVSRLGEKGVWFWPALEGSRL